MKRNFLKSRSAALVACLVALGSGALASAQEWDWAATAKNAQGAAGLALTVDADGEVFVGGSFTGQVDFDSNSMGDALNKGAFLAKYASQGPVLFAKPILGTNELAGTSVAIDGEETTYLAGYFSGTIDFGGTTLTSNGKTDAFLARYSHDGDLVWVKQAGGNGSDAAMSISLDVEANICMTGFFSDTVAFGTNILTSQGSKDVFVAKFHRDGSVLWAKQGGGNMDTAGNKGLAIILDQSNNAYVAGIYSSMSAQFDQYTLQGSGLGDMFLVKYDSEGNVLWAQSGGGSGNDSANAIALDVYDNIFVTGSFQGASTFGTNTLTSVGTSDVFLAKYDSDGNVLWVTQAGSSGKNAGTSVAVDFQGNPHIAGFFNGGVSGHGTINFDGTVLTSVGDSDIFVTKYDPVGHVIWAKSVGGTNQEVASALGLNVQGDCFVTGTYTSATVDFGTTTITNISGGTNYFLTKLEPNEIGVGPIILTPPQAVTNQAGQTITLSVSVTINEFSTFQWMFNGTNLLDGGRFSGAMTPTLSIANVQPGDAGKYSILVSDLDGSVVSQEATVSVTPGPTGPSVSIDTYAGLTINGSAGQTYTIKFTTDMATPVHWTNLTTLTLTNDVHLWVDTDSAKGKPRRFYLVEP